MKLLNKKNNQISFTAEMEESLANAIRRYINEILILAVDEVEISKNDSPLYDETIAHRMGLIPIKTEKNVNEKTTAEIKLKTKKEGSVYSGDLEGSVKIVYDKIPITLLNKGQELDIIAIVKGGKGREHSKFVPGLMFYRNAAEIKVDKDCPSEVAAICPKNVLEIKDGKVIVKNSSRCDLCDVCVEWCTKHKKDSIKIITSKEIIITLESFGQLEEKEIFKKSIEILKRDLTDVSKKIK